MSHRGITKNLLTWRTFWVNRVTFVHPFKESFKRYEVVWQTKWFTIDFSTRYFRV